MKKKFLCMLTALVLALALPASAFASSSAFDGSSSSVNVSSDSVVTYNDANTGNSFFLNQNIASMQVASDFYWAGDTLSAAGLNVGTSGNGSMLIAGNELTVSSTAVADSVRAAGNTLVFKGVTAGNNFTLAGSQVTLDSATTGNGLYVAAQTLNASGSFKGATFTGQTVNLSNFTCSGDVVVSAQEIVIDSSTAIAGTLSVPQDASVTISDGAVIGAKTQFDSSNMPTFSFELPGFSFAQVIFSVLAHILLVCVLFWLMRNTLIQAGELTKTQWGKTVLTGIVTMILLPLILIFACIPLITIPLVLLIVLAMIVIWFISIPFVSAVYGRLIFKNMDPFWAGILLVAILTIVASLPNMAMAVMLVCTILMTGYIMLKLNDNRKARKMEKMQDTINKGMIE